jgi:hypothetical protein
MFNKIMLQWVKIKRKQREFMASRPITSTSLGWKAAKQEETNFEEWMEHPKWQIFQEWGWVGIEENNGGGEFNYDIL